ncbi:HEXXH motif-containing putative peptide modification protein [Bacteriovoracaceae bacterium]|nr:HEXXH motif-containing putative peptide modification protein [Bacteriovoracaceae bacterium]
MYYTSVLKEKFNMNLSELEIDLNHFVLAGANDLDNKKVATWYADLVSFHLETVKEVLSAKTKDEFNDYIHIIDYLQGREVSARQELYTHPLFCRWISQALFLQEDLKLKGELIAEFCNHIKKLPLLTLSVLRKIPHSFKVPVVFDSNIDPVGQNWGLSGPNDEEFELIYDFEEKYFSIWKEDHCHLEIDETAFSLEKAGTGISTNDDQILGVYERSYTDNGVEIGSYWSHPVTNNPWDRTKYCNEFAFQSDLNSTVKDSFDILKVAWPNAYQSLPFYAKYLAMAAPLNQDSHNSASNPIYPFMQAVEIPFNNPLKNLESMVHEMSHCKMYILMATVKLYENKDTDLSFNHPWMEAPRPLRGVILGAHAFLNVLTLYSKVIPKCTEYKDYARAQIDLRKDEVILAVKEIKKGKLTTAGTRFLSLMEESLNSILLELT